MCGLDFFAPRKRGQRHKLQLAVPFSFFASALMDTGGLVRRLTADANALVGHFTGGLGITTLPSRVFFAAISGSSPATVATIGGIMYPALIKAHCGKSYSCSVLQVFVFARVSLRKPVPTFRNTLQGWLSEALCARCGTCITGFGPGCEIQAADLRLACACHSPREE